MTTEKDFRETEAFKRFDESLQKLTGNDFGSYEELFPGMTSFVESIPDMRGGYTPEENAEAFAQLFSLDRITPDMDIFDQTRISTTNRYKANLYQYPHDIGSSDQWFLDGSGGIVRTVGNGETLQRVSIDNPATNVSGFPDFVLGSAPVEAIKESVYMVYDNRILPVNAEQFVEKARGPDIACINEVMNPAYNLTREKTAPTVTSARQTPQGPSFG